jgi:ACS family glucarate transporter-like MFS transporter
MTQATGKLRWWIVFGLIGPITFTMSLDRTAIVVAAPTIQHEYGLSLFQMSLILTSFNWTYASLQVPAGWLAQRFGPRRALAWANLAWSVLTLATPLGFSVQSFVAIRMLLGAGQAADWPASILALKRWFPRQERSKGNSVLLGGLYLGPIAAAPLTTMVIASFGWRWAFYLFGVLGVGLGLAWWHWFRDDPRQHARITPGEASYIAAGQDEDVGAGGSFWRCLGSFRFWAIGMQYFFLVLVQSFYTTWLPTYLMSVRHTSLKEMGVFASLPWVALFVMVFVAGAVADRIERTTGSVWWARVPAAILGFIVSAGALIAASRTADVGAMMALLCVSLGAVGLTQVSIWSATQDLGGRSTGVVSGWANCWGNSAGFVGPVLTALLVRWTGGWSGALLGIALAGGAGAVLWLFVQPQRRLEALEDLVLPPPRGPAVEGQSMTALR